MWSPKSLQPVWSAVRSDWAKQLVVALEEFLENGHRPWSPRSKSKILAVVEELGLLDSDFALNKNYVFDVEWDKRWWREQGILHIHPTMLVAQKPFEGSVDRGPSPYSYHPHFYPLDDFPDPASPMKKGLAAATVLCPEWNIHVTPGSECSYCGEIHS